MFKIGSFEKDKWHILYGMNASNKYIYCTALYASYADGLFVVFCTTPLIPSARIVAGGSKEMSSILADQ